MATAFILCVDDSAESHREFAGATRHAGLLLVGWGTAVPQKQYAQDFGKRARYALSICSIRKPPSVMRAGMSLVK